MLRLLAGDCLGVLPTLQEGEMASVEIARRRIIHWRNDELFAEAAHG